MGWYDYGARMYDASLGRWHTPDPMIEYASPYTYVGNNPMLFVDPFGLSSNSVMDKSYYIEGISVNYDAFSSAYETQGGSLPIFRSQHREYLEKNFAYDSERGEYGIDRVDYVVTPKYYEEINQMVLEHQSDIIWLAMPSMLMPVNSSVNSDRRMPFSYTRENATPTWPVINLWALTLSISHSTSETNYIPNKEALSWNLYSKNDLIDRRRLRLETKYAILNSNILSANVSFGTPNVKINQSINIYDGTSTFGYTKNVNGKTVGHSIQIDVNYKNMAILTTAAYSAVTFAASRGQVAPAYR